jgi:hypothetical protein
MPGYRGLHRRLTVGRHLNGNRAIERGIFWYCDCCRWHSDVLDLLTLPPQAIAKEFRQSTPSSSAPQGEGAVDGVQEGELQRS